MRASGLQAQFGGGGGGHHHQGGGAVVDRAAGGRGDGAVFLERGFERGDLVQLDLAGAFVNRDHDLARAALDRDRRDLGREGAGLGGGLGALHAGGGESVLLGAGEAVLGGAVFAEGAHGAARLVGVFQAVEHHVVEDAVVADAVAAAGLGQQVGRVGHAFHAAGHHHLRAARQQHVVREHGRAHARAAHLAQGDGAGALGQAALETGLARRGLALAGHQAVAEDHFVHLSGLDTGALDRGFDGHAAQVMGGQRGKVALETAHGGAGSADDHDGITHFRSFQSKTQ
jgi:hypothetical protein